MVPSDEAEQRLAELFQSARLSEMFALLADQGYEVSVRRFRKGYAIGVHGHPDGPMQNALEFGDDIYETLERLIRLLGRRVP